MPDLEILGNTSFSLELQKKVLVCPSLAGINCIPVKGKKTYEFLEQKISNEAKNPTKRKHTMYSKTKYNTSFSLITSLSFTMFG